jgi:molybdopterin-containing oxidoreductase family iron-sulfur binding subunit
LVWDSWAEIHPSTAATLGIKHGGIIKVSSAHGELTLKAVLIKSIHPQAIAIPMGQGHDVYGRYASGIGVNPMRLLGAETDAKTGELAMYATRVKVVATKDKGAIVRMGGNDTQMGRKLVATIPAEQLRRTEGA